MTTRRIAALAAMTVLALAALALAGCGAAAGSGADSATGGSSEPPTLKLVKPTAGEALAAGTVDVAVETTGLQFVMPSNTNLAGQGHVHFTLDDQPFKMSTEPSYVFTDVTPGEHTLKAELVQNNTKSFSPPVVEEITFTVE